MEKMSNTALNKIGDVIRAQKHDSDYKNAVETLNNWREAHGAILDSYYDKCVKLAKRIDKNNIIVAQRLKRLPTIIGKLNRFEDMRLSSMQDIAGVRIIASDMKQLSAIEKRIVKWKHLKRVRDYINNPKDSGYRGKHFIFEKNGMFVEIQLRTQFQHIWAASVETIDIFRGTSLKEKDDNSYWHDFFCQVSSIFAIAEGTPVISVYSKFGIAELCSLLQENMGAHQINKKIVSYALTDPIVNNEKVKKAYYIVVTLNFKEKKADVISFKESEYHLAFKEYKTREQNNPRTEQTVLIALNQINKIREAYPNYFMNLSNFLGIIDFILAKNKKKE
ncbi:RelA/SpoT domain-containing protein [Candidatus Saccharibacteria bacterium]|nr:RelA/SpoT domain-containing protein [Candidatus Saccharibacteria bacterium]